MRRYLIQKIMDNVLPRQDLQNDNGQRLANVADYALRTECEMFEHAGYQEQYFILLAERIHRSSLIRANFS
jgi:hypothetical protein